MASTDFDNFIAEEIEKYSSLAIPIHAGFFTRVFVRKLPCTKLHPNPEDEFSIPSVGPSYRIISDYEKQFRRNVTNGVAYHEGTDPVIVEKIHPDGYMLLNGHHRWAAALRLGYKKIPVEIVNVVHNQEIKDIVTNSHHNKRVTLDLDEVVFVNGNSLPSEKPLPFPSNKIYKHRLRLGIPALFRMLEKSGYDIWVYSSSFYSLEYIKALFKRYHVGVTGIVTGTAKRRTTKEDRKIMENLYADKYRHTLHIDNDMVMMIDNTVKEFREFIIDQDGNWSKEVIAIVNTINGKEEG